MEMRASSLKSPKTQYKGGQNRRFKNIKTRKTARAKTGENVYGAP